MTTKQQVLKEVFGHQRFASLQEPVIDAVLAGRSALAVFPTGGGKSLCYQLPATMLPGTVLVVSPLIALMKDQVDHLLGLGVKAARYDSSLPQEELRQVDDDLLRGRLDLLYVSPERLSNERFIQRLERVTIPLMVVDEAHCISEWGHNFRPDYLKLIRAAQVIRADAVLSLTATATPAVGRDICQAFLIDSSDWYQDSFHRPNLELRVLPCTDDQRLPLLLARLKDREPGPGIVYVTLQRTAEQVAKALTRAGHDARAYHAGLGSELRNEIQEWFMASGSGLVVATIAFGMGIDKANIRSVTHFNLPKSVENYAQEIGRAGRDGRSSVCELLACPDDRVVLENFSYGDTPTDQALAGVLGRVFDNPDRFYLSRYSLSYEHDIRMLVLATLLAWLELDGWIEQLGSFPAQVKFEPLRTGREMLADLPRERAGLLLQVFKQAQKARKWVNLDVIAAAQSLEADPRLIMQELNALEAAGDLVLKPKQFQQVYRMLRRPDSIDTLVAEYVQRFEQREQADIQRVAKVLQLAQCPDCRTAWLLDYFGEALDGGHCGHCDRCLGEPHQALPEQSHRGLTASQLERIEQVKAEQHEALAHPRKLARFLCGLSSPAVSRARLMRHPQFGSLDLLPFGVVLGAC